MPFSAGLSIYFENPAGRVLEHPAGYAVFEYAPGTRQLTDLQALLTHTGQLLRRRSWYRMLADQRSMAPFTTEEAEWLVNYWLAPENQHPQGLFAAILLSQADYGQVPAAQLASDAKAAALTYHVFDNEPAAAVWLLKQH